MQKNKNIQRKQGRYMRLNMLELMAILAIVGLIATWVLRHFGNV